MAREKEYREIFNDSREPYSEDFRGETVTIPARGSIVMERREAVQFLAQYKPFDREKTMGEKPLSWQPAQPGAKPTARGAAVAMEDPPRFQNHVTGQAFNSQEELDKDLEGFKHLRLKDEDEKKRK